MGRLRAAFGGFGTDLEEHGNFWGDLGVILGAISGSFGMILGGPDPFSSPQHPGSPWGGSSGREEIQTSKHGPKRGQGDQSEDHPPTA